MPRKPKQEPTEFVAIDVETANSNYESICQIGAVFFKDGAEVDTLKTFINPKAKFNKKNISIHGITEDMVQDAPAFEEYIEVLRPLLEKKIVVHHTHFDRTAIGKSCERCGQSPIDAIWLDSSTVARRTWQDCTSSGYGLGDLAQKFAITFDHHDALADARTAGLIFMHAINESGTSLGKWAKKIGQPYIPPQPRRSYEPLEPLTIELTADDPDVDDAYDEDGEKDFDFSEILTTPKQPIPTPIKTQPKRKNGWKIIVLIVSLFFAWIFISTLSTYMAAGDTGGLFTAIILALVCIALAGWMGWLIFRPSK